MKFLGGLLIACVALALMRAAATVIVLVAATLILWGAIFRPAATYRFLGLCLTIGLFQSYPVLWLSVVSVVLLVDVAIRSVRQRRDPTDRQRQGSVTPSVAPRQLAAPPADVPPTS